MLLASSAETDPAKIFTSNPFIPDFQYEKRGAKIVRDYVLSKRTSLALQTLSDYTKKGRLTAQVSVLKSQ
jgi:hypothetical protein